MKNNSLSIIFYLLFSISLVSYTNANTNYDNIDSLLKAIEQRTFQESKENKQREAYFSKNRRDQNALLKKAKSELARQENIAKRLEASEKNNDIKIDALKKQKDIKLGSLRELFGVLQNISSDLSSQIEHSLTSIEYPNRHQSLSKLSQKISESDILPTIDEIEFLWHTLQQEMHYASKVSKISTDVLSLDGKKTTQELIRIGSFSVISQDGYLRYDPISAQVQSLPKQPSSRFTNTIKNAFQDNNSGITAIAIDPTRGSLTNLLTQVKTVSERIGSPFLFFNDGCYIPFCNGEGGYVGSVILLLGFFAMLLAVERFISLSLMLKKIKQQLKNTKKADTSNPLGRILNAYQSLKQFDVDYIDTTINTAVVAEIPGITKNISFIQMISVISPLLGLLGTVIGMILTFQAITLFGTGDPKTMAGGISTALMTTVLGLCVAIPTVLLHSVVHSKSKQILHILEEQSTGLIALALNKNK